MTKLSRTALFSRHVKLGAQMVDFGGWEMPVQYPGGILKEHLATRRQAGLFDVSHMGRFIISGAQPLPFLQHVLSNQAKALEVGQSQYTILPDQAGGAIDDAYLYRFFEDQYLLVVNAANREKDWDHLQNVLSEFEDTTLHDHTAQIAMLSLQGPQSKAILSNLVGEVALPEPQRNALSITEFNGQWLWLARTGYTGEPLCFELFLPANQVNPLWDALCQNGAEPIGLGARDTLRLEAGLPLYGHELGNDPEGRRIPVFALNLARFAVSFATEKGDYIGRAALQAQFSALQDIIKQRPGDIDSLPRRVRTVELLDKGIARAGAPVFYRGQPAGFVTSGTMVPLWNFEGEGLEGRISDKNSRRAIALALINSRIADGDEVDIEVRGKTIRAGVMPYLLRAEAPPYARPITWQMYHQSRQHSDASPSSAQRVKHWIHKAIDNTLWRQHKCINLIPSEMTPSSVVRMLSIMDPSGRYAEHKPLKAFSEAEVFYYQGTDFIAAVEDSLMNQMSLFLNCGLIETRPVSGQMANMVLFSAMVDFLNRGNRKIEQRRIRRVMNHHIIKGGHLSAQPMGALRDFVMRDPDTEGPAVVNFPVLEDNPYAIDIAACADLLDQFRPELVILGKSMILQKEPVGPIRKIIDELNLNTLLMYDMAHVLGLAGPHFQEPFVEGAHMVTGSTHKTFFGTQRGVVAADFDLEQQSQRELWEAVSRRAFPGSVSNHHLGTLLGLLIAAMEMNAFKNPYQSQVVANAKAFAQALKDSGLEVAGDASIDFTETHQVIVDVGYGRGPEIARALEDNNIICNFQAAPRDEGFTTSGALRLGVAEMTRFGLKEKDFQTVAQFMADVILHAKQVKAEVTEFRQRHLDMHYCFSDDDMDDLLKEMHRLI